ncbi:MAG: DoxX family membrane protein [Thermoanaerobaculia bacterium]|nr:MAG: DoxX family membrane protein [Thermoanaerobaculia bacterium]
MAPLIVLVAVALTARLLGWFGVPALREWAAATRVGLAAMFAFTAAAHFTDLRADLIRMVPPEIPNPEFVVTFTGICELLGAVGLLLPRTRRAAAVALIVFLLAVFPANLHAALSGATLGGTPVMPLVPRVLLQIFFIVLVAWSGLQAPGDRPPGEEQGSQ